MSKPVVVGYMRFSSKTQASGTSEVRQESGFDLFIRHSGLPPWSKCYWNKGDSAYHGRHRSGDFGALLSDCDAKVFPVGSTVWVENIDRFSREKLHLVLSDIERVTSNGYRLHIASQGFTVEASTPQLMLLPVVVSIMLAHEESDKKSQRGKENWRIKREKASGLNRSGDKSAACPAWLMPVGSEYQFTTDADTYRQMFTMALNGFGAGTIRKMLGTSVNVVSVLRNRAAIGEYQPMQRTGKNSRKPVGAAIKSYYPSLVSDDTFFRVQSALDSRKHQRGRRGVCCTNLFGERIYGDDGLTMYIKCESSGRKVLCRKTPGKNRSWLYSEVERALLLELRDVSMADNANPSEDHSLALEDAQKRIDTLVGLLVTNPSEALAIALQTVEKEKRDLIEKVEKAKGEVEKPVVLEECQTLLALLDTTSAEDLLELRTRIRSLLSSLVQRIEIRIGTSHSGRRVLNCTLSLSSGEKREFTLDDRGNYRGELHAEEGENGLAFAWDGERSVLLHHTR